MEIRPVQINDFPALQPLAELFFEEGKLPGAFDYGRFETTWKHLLRNGSGAMIVAFEASSPVGAIGGIVHPDSYTLDTIAVETFWYVHPRFRGQVGVKLIRAFEKWAAESKANRIFMVHLEGLMPGRVKNIYRKLGYSPFETYHVKAL